MQQSNLYIVIFTACLTIILGAVLSFTSESLKPRQKRMIALDTRKKILSAVMEIEKGMDVLQLYQARTKSIVVDSKGKIVDTNLKGEALIAENVNIGKEYKKDPSQRLLPVFMFMQESDSTKVEAYILPVYGNGLWDRIWGFVALETDLNTIKGISFDHKAETPGLGARITSPEIRERYVGKKIFDDAGGLVSVTMLKGEKRNPDLFDQHEVDGLSGATLTAKGVNAMLTNYFSYYLPYLEGLKSGSELTALK